MTDRPPKPMVRKIGGTLSPRAKALPSPDMLRLLLRYDQETGKLFWLRRSPDMFNATTARMAAHACANWNSRYADKEAFTARTLNGYRHGRIFNSTFLAHRVAYAIASGQWPDVEIDHIDCDRGNNRLDNLRPAFRHENQCNTGLQKNNTSGIKGVSWDTRDRKWKVQISAGGKRVERKSFTSFDEAKDYAQTARLVAHGGFARES